jgi:hypothetical protein
MSHFVLCPSCKRHVRPTEVDCPFCSRVIPEEVRSAAPLPAPPTGLSRTRAYAFRAAIVASVAGVACGSGEQNPGPGDGGGATGGSTASGGSAGSTGGNAGTGGASGSGGTTGGGGFSGTPMPYGTVWPDPDAVTFV